MKVGWQDEGDALQPVHHSYSLWLSGLCDVSILVWEVAVQVEIFAVVSPFVALYITCEETSTRDETPTCIRVCNHSIIWHKEGRNLSSTTSTPLLTVTFSSSYLLKGIGSVHRSMMVQLKTFQSVGIEKLAVRKEIICTNMQCSKETIKKTTPTHKTNANFIPLKPINT